MQKTMKKFSTFKTVKDTTPNRDFDARSLIEYIKSDRLKDECDAIRAAPDKDTRSELKARLPAVTASGVFSKRSASNLVEHSGILVADLDLEDNPQLENSCQLAQIVEILRADKHTHFLFVSPSGGLKIGVKIDATCAATHKAAFSTVRDYFAHLGLKTDAACSDVSRLCFLSHDPEAHYNAKSSTIATVIKEAPSALPFWSPKSSTTANGGLTPGDDFNVKTDPAEMLRSAGWTTRNGSHWTRPGKESGVSGTLGVTADKQFWCWSSSAAPLEANKSYNPFALFASLYHSGDYALAATRLAEDGFGESSVQDVSPEVARSIEALVKREIEKEANSWKAIDDEIQDAKASIAEIADAPDDDFLNALDRLAASTDANIDAMKRRAQDAVFILPEIAMIGDCTILNAGPNTGKTLLTLWLLSKRDRAKTKHLRIYYINADDSFNGGIEKMEVLRGDGITTLIPNQNGFDSNDLSKIIKAAINADACGKMVIILDTLKKFVSTMDKNDARIFNIMVRTFTQAGGTLIALAHTNKNKSADGKSIAEGVGDFQSDFDCAYTIERAVEITGESGDRKIAFENTKLRGPNAMKAVFQYDASEKKSWHRRFQSVKRIDAETAEREEIEALEAAQRIEDTAIIDYILGELDDGAKSHSALARNNLDRITGSVAEREKVLDRYSGKLWGKSKGQTSGWNYHKFERKVGNLVEFI